MFVIQIPSIYFSANTTKFKNSQHYGNLSAQSRHINKILNKTISYKAKANDETKIILSKAHLESSNPSKLEDLSPVILMQHLPFTMLTS